MDKLRWKFELVVTGLSEEQCDKVLEWFKSLVTIGHGGEVGGGFALDEEVKEEVSDEQKEIS